LGQVPSWMSGASDPRRPDSRERPGRPAPPPLNDAPVLHRMTLPGHIEDTCPETGHKIAAIGVDLNGNGQVDYVIKGVDADGDGIPDAFQEDKDGDGIPDVLQVDNDGDGIPDVLQGSTLNTDVMWQKPGMNAFGLSDIGGLGRGATAGGGKKHDLLKVWLQTRGGAAWLDDSSMSPDKQKKARQSRANSENGQVKGVDPTMSKDVVGTGCCRRLIVHPSNPRRNVWDLGSLVLVLYDMFSIPMGFFEPPDNPFTTFMIWVTRLFWTCDMPLSFVSGFITKDGSIELRFSKVARKYLRSWFTLDCLVVGVDWFELLMAAAAEGLGFARFGKSTRVFRILRMVRLMRLAKMTEVIAQVTERMDSEKLVILVDVVKLMVIMIGAGHFVACCWYAIGNSATDEKNWLDVHEYRTTSLGFRYVMSLRWAISQFAGGMDEVTPHSMAESIYAIFIYLAAFWSGAVFLSILTSSMTQWYIVGSQQAQQLTILRRYLSQNGISKKLALRVTRNAQHSLAEQQKTMPEDSVMLIKQVSDPLRVELHFEMYNPMLSLHPFFARYTEECPQVVRKVCHGAMAFCNVVKLDTVFDEGETPAVPKMYILQHGLLAYNQLSGEGCQVHETEWVCEHALWIQWRHRGTMTAAEDSKLYTLNAQEFQKIVGQFEHNGFDPRQYAKAFVDNLNALPDDEVWDLHAENPIAARVLGGSSAIEAAQNSWGSQPRQSFRSTLLQKSNTFQDMPTLKELDSEVVAPEPDAKDEKTDTDTPLPDAVPEGTGGFCGKIEAMQHFPPPVAQCNGSGSPWATASATGLRQSGKPGAHLSTGETTISETSLDARPLEDLADQEVAAARATLDRDRSGGLNVPQDLSPQLRRKVTFEQQRKGEQPWAEETEV